jgi:CO/xanthine dehydrogenase FAD-binding subunit
VTVNAYYLPRSVPEALELVGRHGPGLLVMAGGTVAMPLINEGLSLPDAVMGLRHTGLRGLDQRDGVLRIGATTTLTRLAEQDDIAMLRQAARRTASWAVRNLATVGGNLFTPPPGGDIAVALLALDATVTLAGSRGERIVPIADFFTGFMTTRLADDELLTAIEAPIPAGPTAFIKFGRKDADTPAVVTVAARIVRDGDRVTDARIALGAAGPHPIRARDAERALVGTTLAPADIAAAAAAASEACDPFTDAVATDWYRRRMVGVFVARALEQLAPGAVQEVR